MESLKEDMMPLLNAALDVSQIERRVKNGGVPQEIKMQRIYIPNAPAHPLLVIVITLYVTFIAVLVLNVPMPDVIGIRIRTVPSMITKVTV